MEGKIQRPRNQQKPVDGRHAVDDGKPKKKHVRPRNQGTYHALRILTQGLREVNMEITGNCGIKGL